MKQFNKNGSVSLAVLFIASLLWVVMSLASTGHTEVDVQKDKGGDAGGGGGTIIRLR